MMKRIGLITVALALMIAVVSCSDKAADSGNAEVRIDMAFQSPAIAEQLNLAEIVILRVSAEDLVDIVEIVPIVEGKAEVSLDVPAGADRLFEMSVMDEGERTIYYGSKTVTLTQGLDQQVNILLEPTVLLIRPSPIYQEIPVGGSGSVDIYVFEVDSLFGCAFDFLYNQAGVRVDSIKAGDFLGNPDQILFHSRIEDGELSVAVTRLVSVTGMIGVSGSGVIATVFFEVQTQGQLSLGLEVSADIALQRPSDKPEPVDRIEDLYLDNAIVVGRAVQ